MKIEIEEHGLIVVRTKNNMFHMSSEQLNEIEKAIKLARYLVEEMNVKTLNLETQEKGGTHEIPVT